MAKRLDGSRCHLVWRYRIGPGDIVLDGDPASPLQKGGGAQQPLPSFTLFSPCLLWSNGRPSQQLLSSCLHLSFSNSNINLRFSSMKIVVDVSHGYACNFVKPALFWGPSKNFYRGGKNSGLTPAGRIKIFHKPNSRYYFSRIRHVAPTAQEWGDHHVGWGRVPTILYHSMGWVGSGEEKRIHVQL